MVYKLSDRPKWWLPKLMKWVAIASTVFGIIMFIGSMVLEGIDTYALSGGEYDEESIALSLSYFAEEALWGSIGIVFYAAVFWMLSLAVDKIDQLVWLNASDEDREEILAKRKKKNA